MPDRRRRTAIHLLSRDRQSTDPTGSSGPGDATGPGGGRGQGSGGRGDETRDARDAQGSRDDHNPFAAPPEGRPDQPWQPRRPEGEDTGRDGEGAQGGQGRSPWGQWSPRQPGRSSGGWGSRPQPGDQPGGRGEQTPQTPRIDMKDPAQRRARYALLAGIWGFFFSVFDFTELALLLGALALYWGVSSLRARRAAATTGDAAARTAAAVGGAPAPAAQEPTGGGRPQTTAAVSGVVMAALTLVIVAATYTVQFAYRDYYSCVDDSLTRSGMLSCNELLPTPLRDVFGVRD
ncbi:hypothetical protein [Streptomyces sp. ODS05-4]|uniref:hypothetical protein n=1 Tax=Streptomyces sp. ODS05-4 TaxID=2944939 RepID=UPI00210BCB56|nr:hypothetical protein [Streptomyces sp. ODS05-4]